MKKHKANFEACQVFQNNSLNGDISERGEARGVASERIKAVVRRFFEDTSYPFKKERGKGSRALRVIK